MLDSKEYWTYYLNYKTGYNQVLKTVDVGDRIDQRRKREGRMFNTLREATNALEQAKKELESDQPKPEEGGAE